MTSKIREITVFCVYFFQHNNMPNRFLCYNYSYYFSLLVYVIMIIIIIIIIIIIMIIIIVTAKRVNCVF